MQSLRQIRILGRYAFLSGELWMASSLCEAGFVVRGAGSLLLRLKSDDTVTDPARRHLTPRYAIRVNGRLYRDAHMTEPEETVVVPLPADSDTAEIRLIKLSECTQSILALTEIRTDGVLSPLPARPRRIRFIGDSITCGYGVEAASELETFSTFTENAEKGYAALTADALDMDRELVCFSGHGIVSGYTDDPARQNTLELVPPFYEKAGRNAFLLPGGQRLEDIPWDFSLFRPDWIVLNLGTNDLSWCQDDPDRKAYFRREYAAFLKTVRKHDPQARILCLLGVMGTGLNEAVGLAVADYQRETGDGQIHTLFLPEQDAAQNGYGADYHPSEATQRCLADQVVSALRALEGRNAERSGL